MNRNLHPGNTEACDGFDNDCDAIADEGVRTLYVEDGDGDGFGSAAPSAATMEACARPEGFAETADDCDDASAMVNPGNPEVCDADVTDEDCDGEANPAALCECVSPSSRGCPLAGRCAGSTQTCIDGRWSECATAPIVETCNGEDDDCDGSVDERLTLVCFADLDNDGYPAAGAAPLDRCPDPLRTDVGLCPVQTTNRAPEGANVDCDDSASPVRPGAIERCNGGDDDCDGVSDEEVGITCYADGDDDTYAPALAPALLSCPAPGREAVGGCPVGQTDRPPGEAFDCNDESDLSRPGGVEVCDQTGLDEDCDGQVNPPSLCECLDDQVERCDVALGLAGPCADGMTVCAGGRWGGCSIPAVAEVCDDVDQDCDGSTDELKILCYPDADDDGYAAAGAAFGPRCPDEGRPSVGRCPAGATNREPTPSATDCDPAVATTYPGADEPCDGVDANCSSGGGAAADEDADGDGHSPPGATCVGEGEPGAVFGAYAKDDCDDARATVHGGLSAADDLAMCDGRDNDCAALSSEITAPCTFGGRCAGGYCTRPEAVIQLVNGWDHSCALLANGEVHCWGGNNRGEVGDATTTRHLIPVEVSHVAGAVQISAGSYHSCARRGDGTLRCWGANLGGQLGDGGSVGQPGGVEVSLPPVAHVDAGNGHTCAAVADGSVYCWGDGVERTPALVGGLADVVEVAAGGSFSCARHRGGDVSCWGRNTSGQLGDGTTSPRVGPVRALIDDVVELAAFTFHACARQTTGEVRCWGGNDGGQLGDGTTTNRSTPTLVASLTPAIDIDVGYRHSCAALQDGTGECWGNNGSGQLGDGTMTHRPSPVGVAGLATAVGVAAGTSHSCARLRDGSVRCWGANHFGHLGDGTTSLRETADEVPRFRGIARLSGGRFHTCGVTSLGTLSCWGENGNGKLGDGTVTSRPVPHAADLGAEAVDVAAGIGHTCVALETGQVRCFGSNSTGQLGDGTTSDSVAGVSAVGVTDAVQLVTGGFHNCARRSDGTLRCWGDNFAGQVGNGTTADQLTPPASSPVSGVIDVTAGWSHTCAVIDDGTARCWGGNSWGELGDGTMVNSSTAVSVSGLTQVVNIESGGAHTCALRDDQSVLCWGVNFNGELGPGVGTNAAYPTPPALGPAAGRDPRRGRRPHVRGARRRRGPLLGRQRSRPAR